MEKKTTFYKVIITKEFIEETEFEINAESMAISDLHYCLDKNLHTPLAIRKSLDIETRPLTESEHQKLDEVMKK